MKTLRERVYMVLDQADLIGAAWAVANAESDGDPSPKEWENDDDARRLLAGDAVEVLRELLDTLDRGGSLDASPVPEMVFMVWDGGPGEEPYEDERLLIDHGQTYTVCPRCDAVDGGIYEVDRCERWNEAEIHLQPDTVSRYGMRPGLGWGLIGRGWNTFAGLPVLSIHQDRDSDFHTDHFTCAACRKPIALPFWVETQWS